MNLAPAALALFPWLPAHAGTGSTPPHSLPYEEIARKYAASIGPANASPDNLVYEEVLAKNFLHLRLGAFELHFPQSEMTQRAEDFRTCSKAVLDAQMKWLDWLQVSAPDAQALRDDLKSLSAWIKSAKWPVPASGAPPATQDALQLGHAPEAVVKAAERASAAMCSTNPAGTTHGDLPCRGIVILPSRKLFTEFVYFVGWIDTDDRELFWLDAVRDWGQCIFGEDMAVTLEYPIANRGADDYASGIPMSDRGADVLQQQFTQVAMLSYFQTFFGERAAPAFLGGLSNNLVIDLFGEVNTRVDGDLRGKITPAIEVFVPGGASSGGTLAKNSADSRWREKQGADYFLPTLRASQKEGGTINKSVKNRLACFSIRSDDEKDKYLVAAPFLSSAASKAPPPAQFQGEYAELIRSYKSCFLNWLQTKSKMGEKASREAFAGLLRNLADASKSGDFEQVFKDAYGGAPLSNADADKSSLEGQFLNWLSRQK